MTFGDQGYDPWNYRENAGYAEGVDLTGYKIAAASRSMSVATLASA